MYIRECTSISHHNCNMDISTVSASKFNPAVLRAMDGLLHDQLLRRLCNHIQRDTYIVAEEFFPLLGYAGDDKHIRKSAVRLLASMRTTVPYQRVPYRELVGKDNWRGVPLANPLQIDSEYNVQTQFTVMKAQSFSRLAMGSRTGRAGETAEGLTGVFALVQENISAEQESILATLAASPIAAVCAPTSEDPHKDSITLQPSVGV